MSAILTSETAYALSLLFRGEKEIALPNGNTPQWQVELVDNIRSVSPGQRVNYFKEIMGARPDYLTMHVEIFGSRSPMPLRKYEPIKLPTDSDGELKPEKKYRPDDYINIYSQLGYEFRISELDDRLEVNGKPISDVVEAQLRNALRKLGLSRVEVAKDAYIDHAANHSYHPIRDYFKLLNWDGVDQISLLASYFQDEHGAFYEILRLWLIGVVAKTFEASRTRMLILDGDQHIGKSSFVRWLAAPLKEYFYEGSIDPDKTDHKILLMRKFIWEVSEIGSTMRRADIEALKGFLTQNQVTVRMPYGHHPIDKPALASFVGTVNNIGGILHDPTGNTRFMTVHVTNIDWRGYVENCNVNQVWAQAFYLYKKGEAWQPEGQHIQIVQEINDEYEVHDPLEDLITKYFYIDPQKIEWFTPTLDIIQVLHDSGWRGTSPKAEAMMIAPAMKRLHLKKSTKRKTGIQLRGYFGLSKKLEEM